MKKTFIKRPDNIEDLWPLVVEEADLIKQHFSEEEIEQLEGSIIIGWSKESCIYGTMVGNCNSIRVNSFIHEHLHTLVSRFTYPELVRNTDTYRSIRYMTPLEEYIFSSKDVHDEEAEERIDKVVTLLTT